MKTTYAGSLPNHDIVIPLMFRRGTTSELTRYGLRHRVSKDDVVQRALTIRCIRWMNSGALWAIEGTLDTTEVYQEVSGPRATAAAVALGLMRAYQAGCTHSCGAVI